jgi:hypothetical protein
MYKSREEAINYRFRKMEEISIKIKRLNQQYLVLLTEVQKLRKGEQIP